MKKLLLTTILINVLLFAGTAGAEWKAQDDSIPKEIPKYFLIIRYWGYINEPRGGSIIPTQGWVYLENTYSTMGEVIKRLNGHGMFNYVSENRFIGLWRLDGKNKIKIEHYTIPHEKKVRIVDESWTEHKWRLKKKED